ncbi:MAG: ribonucleotide-diphosphate reductase subunit beta [Thermoleophilaceae bacterium]|nr:ribonucleotide-diphosphate reductase subunit beta [Thermoleophilaceae bacterium]
MMQRISYTDLYERWEKGNWSATQLDFSVDRDHWRNRFSELQRRAALWNYALFLHGEDAVADNLSPYIDAAPTEEMKYFLATQQVDEARHAVFFARFMREVVEDGSTDVAQSLERTRPQLTWGFRNVFALLGRTADELRRDRSLPMLAKGIALYHIVIEGTLAQPGQHFIESYLERDGLLPGFREGIRNVALDEQRHIGFGVKALSDLVQMDLECRDAVAELLREVMPYSVAVLVPPGWDRGYTECFGFTLEDIYAEGVQSLETKLRSAGLPLEEMPGAVPIDLSVPPQERAGRAIKLLQGNLIGEKLGPPTRDPEVVALMFDSVRLSIDPTAATEPTTIQWDFPDAEPWFLRVDNGSTRVERGRAERPDVTLRVRFEDWVDIAAGRTDPRLAIATGRLRPRGRLKALWRFTKLFPR